MLIKETYTIAGAKGRLMLADLTFDKAHRHAPIYAQIHQMLRRAIQEGSLEAGTVLLEGHVADILGSTRSPVRQALRELENEGVISRFDGRGYVAGPHGTAPRRIPLEAAMLGVDSTPDVARKTLGWYTEGRNPLE